MKPQVEVPNYRIVDNYHTHTHARTHARTHTHTHTHPFNDHLSRTTRVSQYQKGKTNLDNYHPAPGSKIETEKNTGKKPETEIAMFRKNGKSQTVSK